MDKPLIVNTHDHILEAYGKSQEHLKVNPEIQKKIASSLWAYHELGMLVPQLVHSFASGHYFPYLESYGELENSYQLCLYGFYRYSFIALRNVLELGLLSVYWDANDQAYFDIKPWISSKQNTPYRNEIWEKLLSIKNIDIFEKRVGLKGDIDFVYKILSDYTHIKGYKYSTRAQSSGNFNTFTIKPFSNWVVLMEKVVNIIICVHLLKYPIGLQHTPIEQKFGINGPMGGFLEDYQQETIIKVLSEHWRQNLIKISDEDVEAVKLAQEISEKPDITADEFDEQIFEDAKWTIENQGWKSWYAMEEKFYKGYEKSDPKTYGKFRDRAKRLKDWAIENDCLDKRKP